MVSTTKEGLFKRQSTMILEMPVGQLDPRRAVAKIIYSPSLCPSDRLQMHDALAKSLDAAGESKSLGTAISSCTECLMVLGVVTEVINIAL